MLLDAGVDLPLATQVILLIGQSMQAFWWLWIVLAIGAVMGFRYFKENYPGAGASSSCASRSSK